MTDQKMTCAEKVGAEWADLQERLAFWMEHGPDAEPEGEGPFYEYGLAFDYVAPGTFDDQPEGYFRYQISWGGPSEEVRFYASPKGNGEWSVYRAEFWFLDWWDGASVDVTGTDEAVWLFDQFNDTGTAQHAFEQAAE